MKRRTKKVTSATLLVRGTGDSETSVSYTNAYVWPQTEQSGVGTDGHPSIRGTITLWRVGETTAPRVDDDVRVGSTTFLIRSCNPRLNGDEDSNFAVYDLGVVS